MFALDRVLGHLGEILYHQCTSFLVQFRVTNIFDFYTNQINNLQSTRSGSA
jgi:hypothetical protein